MTAPMLKAAMHRFVIRIALRQHVPLGTRIENPEHGFEDLAGRDRFAASQGDWEECVPPESVPGYGPTVHRLTVARVELYDILAIT